MLLLALLLAGSSAAAAAGAQRAGQTWPRSTAAVDSRVLPEPGPQWALGAHVADGSSPDQHWAVAAFSRQLPQELPAALGGAALECHQDSGRVTRDQLQRQHTSTLLGVSPTLVCAGCCSLATRCLRVPAGAGLYACAGGKACCPASQACAAKDLPECGEGYQLASPLWGCGGEAFDAARLPMDWGWAGYRGGQVGGLQVGGERVHGHGIPTPQDSIPMAGPLHHANVCPRHHTHTIL
jgi:hypothetical protein